MIKWIRIQVLEVSISRIPDDWSDFVQPDFPNDGPWKDEWRKSRSIREATESWWPKVGGTSKWMIDQSKTK